MKSKFILSLALGLGVLSSGCDLNTYSSNYYANQVPVNSRQAQFDARVLGALVVLNKNEIAAASEAQRKSANPAVRNYASWMYSAHNQNLRETENVSRRIGIMPQNGDTARMLQRKGQQEMATLNRLNGKAFDKAYMTAMVNDHTKALALLNNKLSSRVASPLLKDHLEATRAHIQKHLQEAKIVQREVARS
ncbi:DUF4142 domain-containing protein [Legionella fairfieldensis]|uniref:DUF4142 domain-containing protein n=1 Tax=Legionella fairfieldensis TaxID=45064 RepID=UPI00048D83DB|nr:DUF4142 domain-containing protein [Legionella fairfieldensis]